MLDYSGICSYFASEHQHRLTVYRELINALKMSEFGYLEITLTSKTSVHKI